MAKITDFNVAAGQPIRATHINQFSRWLTAATNKETALKSTHASEYALTVTAGASATANVLKLVAGTTPVLLLNGSSANFALSANFAGPAVFSSNVALAAVTVIDDTVLLKQTSISTYSANYARLGFLTNGTLNFVDGTTATVRRVLDTSMVTAAGTILVASTTNAMTGVPIGGARLNFQVNAAATGYTFATSLQSLAVTAGDLFSGSAANTVTRVAMGERGAAVVAGATGVQYEPMVRRNMLPNGDMRVVQRTTLGTTDNSYGIDGCRLLLEGVTCAAISQGTAALMTGASHNTAILTAGSTGAAKFAVFLPIAGVDMWQARGMAVSLQAKVQASATRIGNVKMAVLQAVGTEDGISGDPISAWGGTGTNPTLAANWAYANTPTTEATGMFTGAQLTTAALYKVENVSVSATTVNLAALIWCDDKTVTSADTLTVTDIQIELGAVCTQFERLSYATSLDRCRWFFEVWGGSGSAEAFANLLHRSSTTFAGVYYFAPKRSAPTFSISTEADFRVDNGAGGSITCATLVFSQLSRKTAFISGTVSAGAIANASSMLFAFNTNARIFASAEL